MIIEIDKGVTVGEVVTIKLTSGEEVIASLLEETDKYVKVSKPRVLTAAQGGLGMAPYLFTVDPDKAIKIFKGTVVALEATDKESASSYTQGTTGIIV